MVKYTSENLKKKQHIFALTRVFKNQNKNSWVHMSLEIISSLLDGTKSQQQI